MPGPVLPRLSVLLRGAVEAYSVETARHVEGVLASESPHLRMQFLFGQGRLRDTVLGFVGLTSRNLLNDSWGSRLGGVLSLTLRGPHRVGRFFGSFW